MHSMGKYFKCVKKFFFHDIPEFELVQQSKRFVPGSLVGIKDIDFVGRSEAETP